MNVDMKRWLIIVAILAVIAGGAVRLLVDDKKCVAVWSEYTNSPGECAMWEN